MAAAPRPRAPLRLAALLAALASGCVDAEQPFLSGPMVQNVTTATAVIAWASHRPDVLRVDRARDGSGDPFSGAVADDGPTRLHALTLAGLEPDTRYRYRFTTARGTVESTLGTPPLPGARAICFAALGDSGGIDELRNVPFWPVAELFGDHERGGGQGRVATVIETSDPAPELLLHTGDVVYRRGERGRYREAFFGPFETLLARVPLYPVLGNHDIATAGGAPWLDAFVTPANNDEGSERYYSFDWGDVHFVALDTVSTDFAPGTPQRAFLEEDLAGSVAPWKVVFMHNPPFTDGRHSDDERVVRDLVPLFETGGVDLVISGHDHNYQRLAPREGVTYVVTGGGGSSLYPLRQSARGAAGASVLHFVRGVADARTLRLEAVGLDGRVFDRVTLER